jgi:hypothetical protein
MDGHRCQVVLDDGVLVAADLPPGGHPVHMVRPDEQWGGKAVPTALHYPVKNVCLGGRAVGDEVALGVAIHLRRHDEGHIGVTEVAQRPLEELRERDVVRVELCHDVVALAVLGEPGVVVPGLGPGPKGAGAAVVSGTSVAAEVSDPQIASDVSHPWVVGLVEDPDVQVTTAVLHSSHRGEGRGNRLDRLHRRHDGREQCDPQARWRRHRHRVAGGQAEDPEAEALQEPHQLHDRDESEGDEGRHRGPADG